MNEETLTEYQAEPKASALSKLASRVEVEPAKLLSTLKATVFKGASDDELLALVVTANEYQLNPILKEMYAFPQKGGGIVPVVGIDGWLKIINRQSNFDGLIVEVSEDGKTATCRIYLKDRSHPVEATEYLEECSRGTDPWKTMPRRMLRHKAIIQTARIAFGIGGIQDEDEARDTTMRDATPKQRKIEARSEPRDPFKETEPDPEPEPEEEWTGNAPPEDSPKPANKRADKKAEEVEKKLEELPKAELQRAWIEGYELKEGVSKGKPWRLHVVTLTIQGKEVEAGTFSDTVGSLAEFNVESWARVELRPGRKQGTTELASIEIEPDEEGGLL